MKETKVVCPKCGASIAIPEHESFTAGIAIGKDSGLGTVTLPLESENNSISKNRTAMKASKKIEAMWSYSLTRLCPLILIYFSSK